MTFDINDGRRPSHFELARRATGETTGEIPDDFRAALDSAKARVRPFDWEVLSKHAARLSDEPVAARARSAAVVVGALPDARRGDGDPGSRSDPAERNAHEGRRVLIPSVTYHVMRGEEVFAQDALPSLREGDRVLFTVDPAGHDAMVLLSVDGSGHWTTYYPRRDPPPHGSRLVHRSCRKASSSTPPPVRRSSWPSSVSRRSRKQ
jgi:hypothetical protein